VDDKFERDHAAILAKVKSVTGKPVKYVLNTHQHGDHTGGNPLLLPTAEIIAHRNARANMVAEKMPGPPRVTFSEETAVFLGGKEVRAHYFGRGHTNGDAIIYFPALKVVHTGDLFIAGNPFIDYSAGASAIEWTKTLDKLLRSDWDFDVVIPGHGKVSARQDLVEWRKRFEAFRGRVAEMVRNGKSKDEIVNMLKADYGWNASGMGMHSIEGMITELKQ
jgi:glyoxylase-like metal-dependent hydrolase (beta-lactamase superfamily II)